MLQPVYLIALAIVGGIYDALRLGWNLTWRVIQTATPGWPIRPGWKKRIEPLPHPSPRQFHLIRTAIKAAMDHGG